MTSKTVSQLDANGYFIGPTTADESPREPGLFQIPFGAVEQAPPEVQAPGMRYRPDGDGGWIAEALPSDQDSTSQGGGSGEINQESLLERLARLEADAAALRQELADLSP